MVWTEILLVIATAAYVWATLAYWVMAPWERSWVGKMLFFILASTATCLILICVSAFWDGIDHAFLRYFTYGVFAASGLLAGVTIPLTQYRATRRGGVN